MPKPLDYDELIKTINDIQGMLEYERIEKNIDEIFFESKLAAPCLKGTNYLKQAAIYCYYDEELLYDLNSVYDKVAKDNYFKHINGKNVLWSLQSLIGSYQKNTNKDFLNSYFLYYDDSRDLTPRYLLELLVTQLKYAKK